QAALGPCHLLRGVNLCRRAEQSVELRGRVPGYPVVPRLGACVAKTSPRPYFRACDDSATVLVVEAVAPRDGAKVCASSITSSPHSGRLERCTFPAVVAQVRGVWTGISMTSAARRTSSAFCSRHGYVPTRTEIFVLLRGPRRDTHSDHRRSCP